MGDHEAITRIRSCLVRVSGVVSVTVKTSPGSALIMIFARSSEVAGTSQFREELLSAIKAQHMCEITDELEDEDDVPVCMDDEDDEDDAVYLDDDEDVAEKYSFFPM